MYSYSVLSHLHFILTFWYLLLYVYVDKYKRMAIMYIIYMLYKYRQI